MGQETASSGQKVEGFEPLRIALEKKKQNGRGKAPKRSNPEIPRPGTEQQRILDNPFEEASPVVHPEKWRDANEQNEHK